MIRADRSDKEFIKIKTKTIKTHKENKVKKSYVFLSSIVIEGTRTVFFFLSTNLNN